MPYFINTRYCEDGKVVILYELKNLADIMKACPDPSVSASNKNKMSINHMQAQKDLLEYILSHSNAKVRIVIPRQKYMPSTRFECDERDSLKKEILKQESQKTSLWQRMDSLNIEKAGRIVLATEKRGEKFDDGIYTLANNSNMLIPCGKDSKNAFIVEVTEQGKNIDMYASVFIQGYVSIRNINGLDIVDRSNKNNILLLKTSKKST